MVRSVACRLPCGVSLHDDDDLLEYRYKMPWLDPLDT